MTCQIPWIQRLLSDGCHLLNDLLSVGLCVYRRRVARREKKTRR